MSRGVGLRASRSKSIATLIIGLVIGAILGWILFLAPNADTGHGFSQSRLESTVDPSQTTLPIQTTGTPVDRLAAAVRVGDVPPDFELSDLNGELHTLGQHAGEAVILNFWTTWCPPCRFEMPALQQVYDKYSDDGFTILGINLTQSVELELLEPYREELGLTFPILLDLESDVSGSLYQVLGLPTSVFIDRQGIVREVYVGAIPLDDLENKVQSIMGGGSRPPHP